MTISETRACCPANQPWKFRFKKPRLLIALGLLAMISWSGGLRAESIYVPNYSFESQPTDFVSPYIDSWQTTPQPYYWDTNDGPWGQTVGLFVNPPATNFDTIDNAVGNQIAYIFSTPGAGFFQDYNSTDWSNGAPTHAFNATYTPGKSYTLTVGLTSSSDEPLTEGATLELSLYYYDVSNNMVTVAATNITYDTNVFTNLNLLLDFQVNIPVVNTNDPWAGQHIGIEMVSSVYDPDLIGGVWDVDNVRLAEGIYVPNFSFESQPTDFVSPYIDSWQSTPQPYYWDTNDGPWSQTVGLFLNTPATNSDSIYNAAGNQLAYVFSFPGAGFFQDYNSTDWSNGAPTHAFDAVFETGKSYTLTVGATTSSDEPLAQGATLLMNLYYYDAFSNMIPVAANSITYDTNVFTNLNLLIDFSATIPVVKATDPWAGKHIGIEFVSTVFDPSLIGGVWDLDNVRLSESVATELASPASTNGQFSFKLQSEPGLAFTILSTANPSTPIAGWSTNLGVFTNVSGSNIFTDTTANPGPRFYLAHQVP